MATRNPWFENALLAAIFCLLAYFYATMPESTAQAAGGGWDTNGIMALTTGGQTERLVMVDTNKKNICVYKIRGAGEFRLVGARSYKYDLDMKDTAGTAVEKGNGVTYIQVRQMVQAAR